MEAIPKTPIVLPDILYEFGRWELLPQYGDSLNGLIQTLTENPGLVIELASHTDSRGSDEINDPLSQRRAQSVVDYLIERGIHRARLQAKGYGKRMPRKLARSISRDGFTFQKDITLTEAYINRLPSEEHREAAHALNRRTEFRVLSDDFDPKKAEESVEPVRIQIQEE
jgi:peptidoglycan-associated lipoprotein